MPNKKHALGLLLCLLLFSKTVFALDTSAETYLERGMDFARQNRWDEARAALEEGEKLAPSDKRFPLELAGIAFKINDLSASKRYLHQALSLDPQDPYGNEFLATVYFLEGNVECALKYWNRIDRPRIELVKTEGQFKLRAELLDRAFTFAPADVLHHKDFVASELRVRQLHVFSDHQFTLVPRSDGNFDLVFRGMERNGWGTSKLDGLLSSSRGLFYETVYGEFYNIQGSGINSLSLWRWDRDKRRLFSSLSGLPGDDPSWRYTLNIDLRSETWSVDAFAGDIGVESFRAAFGLEKILNDRVSWRTGAEASKRNFSGALDPNDDLFAEGVFLGSTTGLRYRLIRDSDKRLTVESQMETQIGTELSASSSLFSKIEIELDATWFPKSRGSDGRMRARFRSGTTLGPTPLDELYSLGVDRDHDLWLRAHSVLGGKKGHNPMGSEYVLINLEGDKVLYEHAFFRLTLTPFLDVGKTFSASEGFGSRIWLLDTGVQTKVRLLGGLTAVTTYGKDLRSGQTAVYFNVTK